MTKEERTQLQQQIEAADRLSARQRVIPGAILARRLADLIPRDRALLAGGAGTVLGMFLPEPDLWLPVVDGFEEISPEEDHFADYCLRIPGWLVQRVAKSLLMDTTKFPAEGDA